MRNKPNQKSDREELTGKNQKLPDVKTSVGDTGGGGSILSGLFLILGVLFVLWLIYKFFYWLITSVSWLWLIIGVIVIIIIIRLIIKIIKGDMSLASLFSYRGFGRFSVSILRLMGVVGAAFLIFYIVTATKAWSGGVVDRVLHPMKDRGEVAANCITCNTETKVDQLKLTQQTKGKVPFKKGESLDFERKFNVTRRYKLVDGQKEAILTITSPTHTWKVMVTPEGDYLDSGTTDPVEGWCTIKSDRDAIIKVTYVQ